VRTTEALGHSPQTELQRIAKLWRGYLFTEIRIRFILHAPESDNIGYTPGGSYGNA
jgi:hypothetical protein